MQKRNTILILVGLIGCLCLAVGLNHHAEQAYQAQKHARWQAHYQQTVQIAQPAIAASDAAHDRVKQKADEMRREIKLGLISRQEAARQVQLEGDAAERELQRVQATNYHSPYNPTAQ